MTWRIKSCCTWYALALLAAGASMARAEAMYQCVDAEGHKTFSNVKSVDKAAKCTTMDLGPANTAPAARPAPRPSTPAGFPKVEENTQRERDTDRRRILEGELAAEQKNLDQAKQDLAAQESVRNGDERNYQRVLDRLEPFKNKVALHERNIEAIEKELAKFR